MKWRSASSEGGLATIISLFLLTPRAKIIAVCSVAGCGGGFYAKGFCRTHYVRQWQPGHRAKVRAAAAATVDESNVAAKPPVLPSMSEALRETQPTKMSAPAITPAPLLIYRAWHRTEKKMRIVCEIRYPGDWQRGSVSLEGELETWMLADVILMARAPFDVQSGPLFDGDIVRDDRSPALYRIAFRPEMGWDAFTIGALPPDDHDFILWPDGPHMTVIGNIYENPELLA